MNLDTTFLVTEENEAASTHLVKIIDGDKNEVMFIGSCGLDLSDHVNTPHRKWTWNGHDI